MSAEAPKRVWALLGAHRGDNNQVLALAEALGLPFEVKSLRYNQWRRLQPRLLGATLRSLVRDSRADVSGDPPDLTISTGHRSVPVVQAIRRRSGGRTRAVHLGYPRLSPARFDLVVPTPEYPVPDRPNVLRIPFALTRARATSASDSADDAIIELFPAPRRLLILGGPTLYWTLDKRDVLAALSHLLEAAARDGGSVLVVGSPRTPAAVLGAVRQALIGTRAPAMLVPSEGPPSYPALLAAADTIFVTADSVAMVSDAIVTAKPVGLLPIRATLVGRTTMGLADRLWPGRRVYPRDLRFFWVALEKNGHAGTLEKPSAAALPDLAAEVALRVIQLLEQPVQPTQTD
ncbi:MAG: ELM1/GtrOC1 family putative glycosyltransferase [Sphingomicrobium sp.]